VEPSETPISSMLIQRAADMEVSVRDLRDMPPNQQNAAWARHRRKLRKAARAAGVDEEDFVHMSPDERRATLAAAPGQFASGQGEDEDEPPESVRVFTAEDDNPADDPNPGKRAGVTVGSIAVTKEEEVPDDAPPPDMLGHSRDSAPRTLQDIYYRWPVGDGLHYLRVERQQPRTWQGISVAGYLGNLMHKVSEAEFQRLFGGKDYQLTLYGPDPRGRKDPQTGEPSIKALTAPFKITVPMLPPSLHIIPPPAVKDDTKENHMSQNAGSAHPFNPFLPPGMAPMAPPTTPADASIAKVNADYASNILQAQRADQAQQSAAQAETKRVEIQSATELAREQMRIQSDQHERELKQRSEDAERRIADEKARTAKLEAEMAEIKAEMQRATGSSAGSSLELVREITRAGSSKDEVRAEAARAQLENQRELHRETVATMRASHEAEVKRLTEQRDNDDRYAKRQMEELRTRYERDEKALKDQIQDTRREERDAADRRIAELKETHEARMRDQEKSHDREIRGMKENADTRLTTTLSTKDLEVTTLRDRAAELANEAAEARAAANDAADPAKVLEKAKANAEALGFKKEDEPKGPLEYFMKQAGAGVASALSTSPQWGPALASFAKQAADARGAAAQQPPPVQGHAQVQQAPGQAPAQLPPSPQQQQAQAQQVKRRSRAAMWRDQHQPATPPPQQASTPMGFQSQQPQQPPAAPQQTQAQPAEQPPAQQPTQAQPQPPAAQPAAQQVQIKNLFAPHMTGEQVGQLLEACEQHINAGTPPAQFAALARQHFGAQVDQMLAAGFGPAQIVQQVEQYPNSSAAAITRRDGKAFLEAVWGELKSGVQPPG